MTEFEGTQDAGANGASGQAPPTPEPLQDVIGGAHEAVDRVANQAHETVAKAGERATALYGRAASKIDEVAEAAAPFVKEKPYLAAGLATAAGVVVGMLLAANRPKVIYVKPRD